MPDSFPEFLQAAHAAERRGDHAAAIELARAAARLASNPKEEAAALQVEITALVSTSELEATGPRLERLGAIAEAIEDETLRGEWLLEAARWIARRGNPPAAERKALEAAEIFAGLNDFAHESTALLAASEIALGDGRLADGAAHQSAALALARRSGQPAELARAGHRLANSLWELGEWGEAEMRHAEAYAAARLAGSGSAAEEILWDALSWSARLSRWHAARQAGDRLYPSGLDSNPPAGFSAERLNRGIAAYGLALFHTGEREAAQKWLAAAEPELAAGDELRSGVLDALRELHHPA